MREIATLRTIWSGYPKIQAQITEPTPIEQWLKEHPPE